MANQKKKSYKLMLIDLDGTMYRGEDKIEEAPHFIRELTEKQQSFLFLTNNSTKTQADVVTKLSHFGIPATEEQVYTTSMATADYVTRKKKQPVIYMIGENGLEQALKAAGCTLVQREEELNKCDFVVIGLDRSITYEKLAKATMAIRHGATFLSTNADQALPTEKGLLPGNGSLTAVISTATGVEPIFIGKPESLMIDLILEEKKIPREQVLMIGDNYETDILAGIGASIDTAIVFTGFTSKEELQKREKQPTFKWKHLLAYRQDIEL